MVFITLLLSFIILINVNLSMAKRECLSVLHRDFSDCSKYKTNEKQGVVQPSVGIEACSYEKVCNKTFRVAQIEYQPISNKMFSFIKQMLSDCCGHCAKPNTVASLKDNSELIITMFDNADIIFPIFSFSSTRKIYGFRYMPIIEVPSAYYFQRALSQENSTDTMLKDLGNLWPMLLICFVFALGAGLLIWLLDTWANEEEFPREFLIGWFEGFWWSFISMTTVGYGDKAPKSRLARMFSIGWILIGITIFSMLTASLTTIITNAEKPPSVDMTGKRIGALEDRVYDANVIARHGGLVQIFSHENLTHGIDKLLDALFSEERPIDGFLLDKFAYLAYIEKKSIGRFDKTFHSEKTLGKKYVFGALIRGENEFNYLSTYVEYNWFHLDTCLNIGFNEKITELITDQKIVVFSLGCGVFQRIMIVFSATILTVFFIGTIISKMKERYGKKRRTTAVEMN